MLAQMADQPINGPVQEMVLRAPAKINLCLHVIGQRPDGYHDLFSLMCGVALYDHLVLGIGAAENTIQCDHPVVPVDESNLALKAALLFNQTLDRENGIRPQPVSIRLIKQIPVCGGLGGGSSDAAAVLKGLNHYYDTPCDRERLLSLAARLGADVPFFIDQRPALAEGIGDRLTPYHGLPAFGVVLVCPDFGISTAQVFGDLNFGLTKSKKKLRYKPFKNGNFSATDHLHNDLEAGVIRRFPVVEKIKKVLIDQGASGSLMSGSGSTVFGLFEDQEKARRAVKRLDRPDAWQVFATRLLV